MDPSSIGGDSLLWKNDTKNRPSYRTNTIISHCNHFVTILNVILDKFLLV